MSSLSNPARLVFLVLAALLAGACRAAAARPEPPPRWPAPAVDAPESAESSVLADLAHAPRRMWADGRAVYGSGRNLLWIAGVTAYGLLAEHSFEEREAVFFRNHTILGSDAQSALGALGNGLTLYGGALTWYFWTRVSDDVQGYEASKTLLSALSVTTVTTLVLKGVVSDGRPNGGAHDFPSGHSSLSFAAASTLDALYGHRVGIPAYALATLVGVQRLDVGKHDTGSVFFGGVLGTLTGLTIAGRHAPRIFGGELGFAPDPDSGALGLALTWTR